MNVYLIGKILKRARAVCEILSQEGVRATVTKTVPADAEGKSVFIFFAPALTGELKKRFKNLLAGGSLIIVLETKARAAVKQSGVLNLPSAVTDSVLASLITWFLSWKDKEAHFAWVTTELQKMNGALEAETARLKQTTAELDSKNQRIKEELALANIIQNNMLPKQFPAAFPISFAHKYIPHEYIGGDFFEVIELDENHLGILIADVSGHGVSSALITAMLKSSFTHAARGCLSPSAVLSTINREFTNIMRSEHYITGFYCIIDTEAFTACFANAGHPKQLLLRTDGRIEHIGANGFFLGMFEQTQYDENSVSLEPGDRIIFFTDGIIECPNARGVNFGKDNLIKILTHNANDDIEELSKRVIVELISHNTAYRFPDDITLLIAEIIPFL